MSPIEGCFSFWYFQSSNVQLVSTKKKLSWTNTRSLKEKAREDLPHHAHSELGHYSTDAWRAPQGPKHYVSWTRGLIGGRVSILADKGKLLWLKKRSGELHSGPRQRQPLPKDAISPSPFKGHTILQYQCGQGTQPIFIPIWHLDKVRWVGQSWGAGVFVPRFLQINRNPRDATKCTIDHLVDTTRIKVPHNSSHSCVPGPRTLTSLRILQRRQQTVEVPYLTRKSVVKRFCRIRSPFSIIWEYQQDCNSQQMTPKTYRCQRSQIIFRLIKIPGQK